MGVAGSVGDKVRGAFRGILVLEEQFVTSLAERA